MGHKTRLQVNQEGGGGLPLQDLVARVNLTLTLALQLLSTEG